MKGPPRTRYATHTMHRGTPSECLFFFGIYSLLTRQLWCFSATLWRPMGQSPSKTKVLPTCNAVHRLMLSTHHLVRTHDPPLCVTPCPSFPGGIAACAAPPLPPLPPRGVGFDHVPPAQETMRWGGWGSACAQLRPRSHFGGPCVRASCLLGPWFPVCRVSLSG